MSDNPHANGGLLLRDLKMPDFRDYAVDVPSPGATTAESARVMGKFLRDVMKQNLESQNFRLFSPDENNSNRWQDVLEVTDRCYMAEIYPEDDKLSPDGRVMEVLSEHQCQGWLEGYLLTGRHGFFSCYEAFIHIIDSMFNQHAKWLKVCNHIPWRRPIASFNYFLSSHVWRQDHNGFSHQDPGFIDHVVNKKAEVIRVYLPPDANCLLSVTDHCLRSRNYVNVVVAGKQPAPQWLTMDQAVKHCTQGLGIWEWASNDKGSEPDVVMACCGDVPTLETLAAVELSEAVVGEGQRLSRLVENLLDVSRLETGNAEPHREQVDLAEVLEAARDSLGLDRDGFRISGRGRPADPARRPRAARARLREPDRERGPPQRWQAGPRRSPNGRAAGSSSASSTRAPESPNRRGSGSSSPSTGPTSVASGSGLGLAIAKGFVEANGGDDRDRVAARARARPSSSPSDGTAGDGPLSDATRVLVCDDEPQILRALRVILRDAGFEAVTAEQRRGGARPRPRCRPPEAAILDLMLPDIDGVEVTRAAARVERDADHRPLRGRRGGGEGAGARRRRRRLRDQAVRAAGAGRPAAGRAAPGRPEESEPVDHRRRARDRPRRPQRPPRRRGGPPDPDRVRAAAGPRRQPGPADDPPHPAGRGLGGRVRRRPPGPARPRRQPAPQDRARRRTPLHPHRPRRRLPLRRLEGPSRILYTTAAVSSCGLDGVGRSMIVVWISSQHPRWH